MNTTETDTCEETAYFPVSFLVDAVDVAEREQRPVRIYAGASLLTHMGIAAGYGLRPGSYREAEWKKDDDGSSLRVRTEDGDDPTAYRVAILEQWPNRTALLHSLSEGRSGRFHVRYRNGKILRHPDGELCCG